MVEEPEERRRECLTVRPHRHQRRQQEAEQEDGYEDARDLLEK